MSWKVRHFNLSRTKYVFEQRPPSLSWLASNRSGAYEDRIAMFVKGACDGAGMPHTFPTLFLTTATKTRLWMPNHARSTFAGGT